MHKHDVALTGIDMNWLGLSIPHVVQTDTSLLANWLETDALKLRGLAGYLPSYTLTIRHKGRVGDRQIANAKCNLSLPLRRPFVILSLYHAIRRRAVMTETLAFLYIVDLKLAFICLR